MSDLTTSRKKVETYFKLLNNLDKASKRKLIARLTESLEQKEEIAESTSLFGAWADEKNSDTIIKEIRESRVERTQGIEFE